VDEAHGKPSLVDDPEFLADLEELDRGLNAPRKPTRVSHAATAVSHAASAPVASPVECGPADAPIVLQPGSKRPLLDLFPSEPTSAMQHVPAPLGRGTTSAPRLPRPMRVAAPFEETVSPVSSDQVFYGFAEPPFALEPDLRFLYHCTEHDRVLQEIVQAIARRDPLIVVTGPPGVGKTLLCMAIPEQLDRRALTSVIRKPPASFDELVQSLLADFGVFAREEATARAARSGELVDTLRTFLGPLASLHANAVIVLDEAQNIAPEILVALDALAESVPATIQIVLAGQPILDRQLGRAELHAVNQRIALRLQLGPLAADEVPGYVMHRIHVAAAGPRIDFDDIAFELLYGVSGGVARTVNLVCDRALALGSQTSKTLVGEDLVAAAADDLGLSPSQSSRSVLQTIAVALVALVLLGLGASAAAWMFRDRVQRILTDRRTPAPAQTAPARH